MSEEIIPLTSSFLIKTGRVYAGMSVIGNHTYLFQMAGFAPERWQELYNVPHFLDRRIKWKFIHLQKLKNEQDNNPSTIYGVLQDEGLPSGTVAGII